MIRNYVTSEFNGKKRILIGNDEDKSPVLQEVSLGEVWDRLKSNHDFGLLNRERINKAQAALTPEEVYSRRKMKFIKMDTKRMASMDRRGTYHETE